MVRQVLRARQFSHLNPTLPFSQALLLYVRDRRRFRDGLAHDTCSLDGVRVRERGAGIKSRSE